MWYAAASITATLRRASRTDISRKVWSRVHDVLKGRRSGLQYHEVVLIVVADSGVGRWQSRTVVRGRCRRRRQRRRSQQNL
nr:unnamed protein product [Digitaria exilis]